MPRDWNELEGVSLAGRYWLKQCLSATANEAWYLTRFDARDAAVCVLSAGLPEAEERLAQWRGALSIEHPNLVRMLDAGRTEAAGLDLVYSVSEYPDDFLAAALAQHPLSPAEAAEVLEACLAALGFLHRNGFVHGAVATGRIVAIGDKIKLPSDTIHRPQARRADAGPEPYDAPEVAAGGVFTPAADMWSLAVTLVEILRRERISTAAEVGFLPEPFATIVAHTLREDPVERWSVAEVEAQLHAPAIAPPAAVSPAIVSPARVAPPAPEPQPSSPPPPEPEFEAAPGIPPSAALAAEEPPVHSSAAAERVEKYGLSLKWVPLAGVVAAIGLGAVFLPRATQPGAKSAAPATAAPAPAPAVSSPPPAAPPSPAIAPRPAAPSTPLPDADWRLVVYEYARRSDAELEARRLNRRRPAWHAEVFAPRMGAAPYFVTLGGVMTRPEAERLKQKARAAGLPRDTFVRNFPPPRPNRND